MIVAGGLAAVAAAVAVAFLWWHSGAAHDGWYRTAGPEGDVPTITLPVGACAQVDLDAGIPVDAETVVPCAGRHDLEVVARHELVAAPVVLASGSPFDEAVLDAADRGCVTAFELYVDVPYWDSNLDYLVVLPDQSRWHAGEREVICLVVPWDDPHLVGVARGSGR